ncbi:unnamed protein product, partial [Prorocentrum cordatum]
EKTRNSRRIGNEQCVPLPASPTPRAGHGDQCAQARPVRPPGWTTLEGNGNAGQKKERRRGPGPARSRALLVGPIGGRKLESSTGKRAHAALATDAHAPAETETWPCRLRKEREVGLGREEEEEEVEEQRGKMGAPSGAPTEL